MLLCIEMMIFAVMHLFAFPWKIYSVASRATSDPVTASGAGWSGKEPHYLGGPFGIKAYAEAFNPWDMIKATARGLRWLFVGRRFREQDVSYQRAGEGTKMQSLPGAFPTTTLSQVQNIKYTNSDGARSAEPSPSRAPYPVHPDPDTAYRGGNLPQMPRSINADHSGELASRHNYAQPERTYLEPQPYKFRRSHSGDMASSHEDEFDEQDAEDRAALLRYQANPGRVQTADSIDSERYHKRIESSSDVHPAFRRESDVEDRGGWT